MAVNMYTTGGAGDGKTTLAAAILYCLATQYPNLNAVQAAGADSGAVKRELFATPSHSFSLVDAPAATREAALASSPKMDIALLVISSLDGPQQGTVDAIEQAKAAGVSQIVAYLSKTDRARDEELLELLELETRELLSHHGGYDGDSVAIFCGSATEALGSSGSHVDPKAASIFALVAALDTVAPALT
jgi:elongation factor Tu